MSNMTLTMVTRISWVILLLHLALSYAENKTSSECWGCKSITPHNLSCNGSSLIVIQSASYGYKVDCPNGITRGGCIEEESNRCCKPGGNSSNCFKPFNVTDKEELERTCSSKSTCTFNSTRYDQQHTCGSSTFTNSFTLINYTCQTTEASSTQEHGYMSTTGSDYQANITSPTTAYVPSTQQSDHITTTDSSDQGSEDHGGDDGAGGTTAAIVICVLLVIVGAAVVLFFFIRKRRYT